MSANADTETRRRRVEIELAATVGLLAELTRQRNELIVKLADCRVSTRDIGEFIGMSHTTVCNIIKAHINNRVSHQKVRKAPDG